MNKELTSLRNQIAGLEKSPAYIAKQMHPVPDAPSVERLSFIVSRCRDQDVLDIGASGHLHDALRDVSRNYWGIDHPSNDHGQNRLGIVYIDLDHRDMQIPKYPVSRVVVGEVVEHLRNPGFFFDQLHSLYPNIETIITVPNAISDIARKHMERGVENVHFDHSAWYSYHTLQCLIGKSGYRIRDFAWYNGRQRFAEGLIVVAE